MIKVVSVEQMRRIEAAADASGVSYTQMMEHAGRATAERAKAFLAHLPNAADARITVLIGAGNNGGDGLVAARILKQETPALVRLYLLKRRDDALFEAAQQTGAFIAFAEDDQRYRVLTNMIASAHLVIDALFGIGVTLPLRDDAAKVLRAAKAALVETDDESIEDGVIIPADLASRRHQSHPYVLAVDCPSGLNCDTGELDKNALSADETVTFIAAKPGLFTFPGAEAVGTLAAAGIGVPQSVDGLKDEPRFVVDADSVRALLPPRHANAHKGTHGRALIVGGSVNYTGAPGLAARAAYRSGAGLVSVGAPAPTIAALAAGMLEATWLLLPHDMGVLSSAAAPILREEVANCQAMLLGPGWGRDKVTRDALQKLLAKSEAPRSRRVIGFSTATTGDENAATQAPLPPLVIDADGLNLLSELENWWELLPAETILTPHPGEMSRLCGIDTAEVQARRWELAVEKAREWNAVIVLKGAHTLIANPDGRVGVLPFKTAALATAGTGDVLGGLIVGLLAQGMNPFDAAVCAAYLHGAAGDMAAKARGSTRGVIASDVLDALSTVYQTLGV